MNRKPLVAVITVNWFGGPDTVDCLRSLTKLDHREWMAVVVDNGSTDGSPDLVLREMQGLARQEGDCCQRLSSDEVRAEPPVGGPARYTLIDAGGNVGFAAGNNLGIRWALAAGADYIWILNNDVEVDPGALTALLARMEATRASVVGSVLVYFDRRDTLQCVGGARYHLLLARGEQIGEGQYWDGTTQLPDPTDLAYVAGASMLVAASTIRQVGSMDERYFLYFEEIDWMCRLRRAGPAVVATRSVVFHKEGASIGTASRKTRSLKSQYYLSRNMVLFYRWRHPLLLPIALLRNVREAQRLRTSGLPDHARMVMRATVDAILGRHGMWAGL